MSRAATAKRRAAARRPGRKATQRKSNTRVFIAIVVGTIALFAVAIVMTRNDDDPETETQLRQTQSISIEGAGLPAMPDQGDDPAAGMEFPQISGKSFSGRPLSIRNDGTPKIVILLAHWCPHCQAEVPVVQEWIDTHGAPDGVELVSISTGVDEGQPNYPPSEWLAREGWTVPVIADDATGSAERAVGLTGFPFWVFVNADGTVASRAAGELPVSFIEEMIQTLRAG